MLFRSEEATARGIDFVLAGNDVVSVDGDLDREVTGLADAVAAKGVVRA